MSMLAVMIQDLPPTLPVDRSRIGIARIAIPMLGHFLRLPPGQEVVAARLSDGDTGTIELLIEGTGGEKNAAEATATLTMIMHTEFRESGGFAERRVVANWEHEPARSWIVQNWEPAP